MHAIDRFRLIAAASLTDGKLGPEERRILDKAARELKLEETAAEEVIDAIRDGSADLKVSIPQDAKERAQLFRQLVDIVTADGEVDAKELRLFQKLGPAFKLDELMVEDLLRAGAEAARAATKRATGKRKP
jgi:uncharacterized tellurite resistance protein B-like protein